MALAGILAGIYWLDPNFYPTVGALIVRGNVDDLIEFLQPYGLWAMVVSFFINVLINALGFLPSIFISTANGVLFGVVPGILISWLAECTGVIAGFYLMRSILRHSAEVLIAKSPYLKKVDEFSSNNGFKVMLFARSLPYFPSGVITALGAVSSISSRDYILATLIGKFPSTALEVIIGHDVVNYEKNLLRLTLVVLSVILIYLGLWWYQRRRKLPVPAEEQAQTEQETE
ncbi:MAG: TVP38/TMEM64 family protein [Negativicutes bacterium]|nr:TVP38/TMEM64 family protein [Negativicutes bacterium]